jgi:hypothetical protein
VRVVDDHSFGLGAGSRRDDVVGRVARVFANDELEGGLRTLAIFP